MNEGAPPQVVFIAAFPPPMTGLAIATKKLADILQSVYDIKVVCTTGVQTRFRPFYHLSRMARACEALWEMARFASVSRRDDRVCYIACDGGLGTIYTVGYVLCARLLRYRIYLHHHSFNYIDRRMLLMQSILVAGSSRLIHIFLSEEMAQAFANQYTRPVNARILSNAAWTSVHELSTPHRCSFMSCSFTIGLLSNLDAAKGLYIFLDLFDKAKMVGLDIKAVLAGPVVNSKDIPRLMEYIHRHAGELVWRGPLYGADKEEFFADIDLFVFPTSYFNEAQPLVVFEAMARGVPVIAFNRGAIAMQILDAGLAIPPNKDFIAPALEAIAQYVLDPREFENLRRLALQRFEEQKVKALLLLPYLFSFPQSIFKPD